MVHFERWPLESPRKDYWKLPDLTYSRGCIKNAQKYLKENCGYKFEPPSNLQTLGAHLSRHQRGLIWYEGSCTTDELVVFCKQRGIHIESQKKEDLIQRLEQADDEKTFNGFVHLPPVARLMIYANYYGSFDPKHFSPALIVTPPPLAQTCQIIRSEAMDLFYATHKFHINIDDEGPQHHLSETTANQFSELPISILGSFSKLWVSAFLKLPSDQDETYFETELRWLVEVWSSRRGYEAVFEVSRELDQQDQMVTSAIDMQMRAYLESMKSRDGGMRLKRSDGEALVEAFATGLALSGGTD